MRVSFVLVLLFLSFGFAGTVEDGPFYIKGKYYSLGKENMHDGSVLGEDYEVRFWTNANFGANVSRDDLYKIAKDSSNNIKKSAKTHIANKWCWQKIEDNQYLMIGYSDSTNSQFSYAVIKKRKNDWIYSCNGDGKWKKVDNKDSATCKLKKGYDTIKFQFYNPEGKRGWSGSDILYRFAIYNR